MALMMVFRSYWVCYIAIVVPDASRLPISITSSSGRLIGGY